jgi:hypothetical protein
LKDENEKLKKRIEELQKEVNIYSKKNNYLVGTTKE